MEFGCMSPKIITDGWFASQRSMIVIAVSQFHVYVSSSLVEAFSKHKLREGLLTALVTLSTAMSFSARLSCSSEGKRSLDSSRGWEKLRPGLTLSLHRRGHLAISLDSGAAIEGPRSFHKAPTRVHSHLSH